MCQQSAEKYLKAYLFLQGQRVITTHSIKKLIEEAADHEESLRSLKSIGTELDAYYFATRYPDALVDDIPAEHFSKEDAQEAIEYVQRIAAIIEPLIKKQL